MGEGSKPIEELFPITLHDPRTGRQYWHETAAVAEAVAKELFEKCSRPPTAERSPVGGRGGIAAPVRARVSDVQMSFGKLMGHPAITGGRDGRVDVDDVLWLFMRHWLVGTNILEILFRRWPHAHRKAGFNSTSVSSWLQFKL